MSPTAFPALDPAASLAAPVDARIDQSPASIALIAGEHRLSYRELGAQADLVGARLAAAGVTKGDLVGVCLPRTPHLVATLIAVLRAGAAYVPLDPEYPRERLEWVIGDARAPLVVTDRAHEHLLAGATAGLVYVDAEPPTDVRPARAHTGPDDLAYVLYTSGSTGRPKGVRVTHRGVTAMLRWAADTYRPDQTRGVLFATSVCFDISVYEIFFPLAVGGTVILVENVLALADAPARDEVTLINTVPSAIAALLRGPGLPPEVRTINLVGEALSRRVADQVYACPQIERLYNLYGPTEDTVYSTWALVDRTDRAEPLIGIPLPGTTAHVHDEHGELAPPGELGELYLAGEGLAQGYHGRPDLTAERFVTVAGERRYRTGDLVRRRPDGALEYHGRVDHQVKLRGFRIELGEIEAVLTGHPGVQAAAVVLREDAAGPYLAAFVQGADRTPEPTPAELRAHCLTRVPTYMLPDAVTVLADLPLTLNGKIDRNALPAATRSRFRDAEFVAPRTPTETRITELFRDVLDASRIGVHDPFLESGGNSLLAVGLLARIERTCGVRIPLDAFFAGPTPAAVAERVDRAEGTTTSMVEPPHREPHGPALVGTVQREFTMHELVMPGSALYSVPLRIRATGALDVAALGRALGEVVRRHEVLRTALVHRAGEPVAEIRPPYPVEVPVLDLPDTAGDGDGHEERLDALLRAEAARPLDRAEGRLLRALVVRVRPDRHELLLTVHHIAMDGWSIGLLLRDLARAYQGLPLAEPALQYRDVAAWERRYADAEHQEARRWAGRLEGLGVEQHLPGDRDHPDPFDPSGARLARRLDPELMRAAEEWAAGEGASLYMTLLAALGTLVHRCTGRTDQAVLTPFAARPLPELEGVLGPLLNTVPLRFRIEGTDTFREVVHRLRPVVLDALDHCALPYLEQLRFAGVFGAETATPVSQILLAVQNHPGATVELPDLTLEFLNEVCNGGAKVDLSMFVEFPASGPLLSVEYRTGRYDPASIEMIIDHLMSVLAEALAAPDRAIEETIMLDPAEYRRLVEADNPAPTARPELCLPDLLAEQIARTPHRTAVSADTGTLTYAELDAVAYRLANTLRAHGAERGTLVAIAMPRSHLLPAALLGVLRTGAAYLPIDTDQPIARNRALLDDAKVTLIVGERVHAAATPLLTDPGYEVVLVDGPEVAAASSAALPGRAEVEDPAYLIHTSGSTGRPKAVVVPHRAIVNFLLSMADRPGLGAADTMAAVTTLTFDIAALELWLPLVVGARVEIASRETAGDGGRLAEWLARREVTVCQATPATWRMLLDAHWSGRPDLVALCGGEALTGDLAGALLDRCARVWNMYGPTETTVWSTVLRVDRAHAARRVVPLGTPIANTRVYVLDAAGRPAPVNAPGELCIAGAGVALGYLGRAEQTAERFVRDPLGPPGTLMYRTGDIACRRRDGTLEYHGRADHQVKLRGFRIELGEIEAALTALAGVTGAVATLWRGPAGPTLVGYVVTETAFDAADLSAALGERLPRHLVPGVFVPLDALPLTPAGKIDRAALPEPRPGGSGAPPEGDCEEILAEIWHELLGPDRIGRDDGFLALGGNSLLALRLMALVSERFEIDFPLRVVFEAPTLAAMARRIEDILLSELDQPGAPAQPDAFGDPGPHGDRVGPGTPITSTDLDAG
ncbi:non-ribosomal peptide synthetase [Embleya scabrispora]|uniref:non-ribosomal peptide synthetase n=1 Tax=Embleya scabrispora TaxID=159449 RepID=UPI000380A2AA|nr:non-ribosomal peptide synthetase [Embleya scabrispora]MYS78908.1 non-ribosomal peptide synthetase [Streptomyces sp. SID5474]